VVLDAGGDEEQIARLEAVALAVVDQLAAPVTTM
jgi:hypothetical protein